MKVVFAALAAACLALSVPAGAATYNFDALLEGLQETPPNASPATGTATAVLDDVANTLNVTLTYSGLLGTSAAGHIHCCAPPGTAASVVLNFNAFGFVIGQTADTYTHLFSLPADLSSGTLVSLIAGLMAGNAYIDVHSTVFPGGEIRGQLIAAAVPVPGAAILFGSGLGLIGWIGRRRKQAAARAA